jgi:hypothetical protein
MAQMSARVGEKETNPAIEAGFRSVLPVPFLIPNSGYVNNTSLKVRWGYGVLQQFTIIPRAFNI